MFSIQNYHHCLSGFFLAFCSFISIRNFLDGAYNRYIIHKTDLWKRIFITHKDNVNVALGTCLKSFVRSYHISLNSQLHGRESKWFSFKTSPFNGYLVSFFKFSKLAPFCGIFLWYINWIHYHQSLTQRSGKLKFLKEILCFSLILHLEVRCCSLFFKT